MFTEKTQTRWNKRILQRPWFDDSSKKKAEIPIIKVSDSFFTQKYLKWLKTCELNKGDSIHQNVDAFQFQA